MQFLITIHQESDKGLCTAGDDVKGGGHIYIINKYV